VILLCHLYCYPSQDSVSLRAGDLIGKENRGEREVKRRKEGRERGKEKKIGVKRKRGVGKEGE
jgi:hypothetical protein